MRLSLVVGLYNMGREIPRSLHTMSPARQGLSEHDYEIILVDNGSREPFGQADLQELAPNVRYVYVENALPSPTGAINEAVAQSVGELVTVVIDGARMFSPGVLKRTLQAFEVFDDPYVYVPSLHLGAQLQNDLAMGGYDQQVEDALLTTVAWKDDPYQLFGISNIEAVSERLMLPTFESNCFTVHRSTWNRVGGYHDGFSRSTGGGLANWELFSRYINDEATEQVLLIGEATFHQFHGGASTNKPRAQHPVRGWLDEHQEIFGRPYAWPDYQPVLFGQPQPAVIESLYYRNVHTAIALMRDLATQGEHDAAIAIANALVERFPNDPAKLQLLAEALDRASRRAQALDAIDAAIAIAPTQAELHVTQGIIHVGRNDYDQARASYDQAIELDDLLAEAYFHRGHLSQREHDPAAAARDFKQAIASVPNPPPHYATDLAAVQNGEPQGETRQPGETGQPDESKSSGVHEQFMASVQRHYGDRVSSSEIDEHARHGSFSVEQLEALTAIVDRAAPTRLLIVGGFLGLSTKVVADATETIGSTIVSVDPNVRHRVFDQPLDHARLFVSSDRVQFIDGFYGAATSGGTRFDLVERSPEYGQDEADEALANVAVVAPAGSFDFALIDADYGTTLELTAIATRALLSPATVVLAGLDNDRLGELMAFGSADVEVDVVAAGFVVVRRVGQGRP